MKTFLKQENAIEYLSRAPLTLFEVYWVKSKGSKVKIHAEGAVLCLEKRKKIIERPESFEFKWMINSSWIIQGLDAIEELLRLESARPIDLISIDKWRVDFINWVSPCIWEGNDQRVSYLDLSALMMIGLKVDFSNFYEKFINLPCEVQTRNLVISSSLSIFSMIIGYIDYGLIQDIFKTFTYLDFIYTDSSWSLKESSLLKRIDESGIDVLSSSDKNFYKLKILAALEKAQDILKRKLHFPYIADYLSWSSESYRGHGAFKHAKLNEMNDFELLMVLFLQNFKYDELLLSKVISRDFYNIVLGEKNISTRIKRIISSSVEVAGKRNDKFLKISGL